MHLQVLTDGACWNNPGPASIGAVIKSEKGEKLRELSQFIGNGTNNQAEYRAVIEALKVASKLSAETIAIYLDSELVLRQLAGRYKVKSILLQPLYLEAKELISKFRQVTFYQVSHDGNEEAHMLAQRALVNHIK